MIGYLRGTVLGIDGQTILLLNNGVGYEVQATASALECAEIESEIGLYAYLVARDSELALYGFATKEEKDMFLSLITVTGVGPKSALAILSNVSSRDLARLIYDKDVKTLQGIKGIGKKTAERIVLDLSGSLNIGAGAPYPKRGAEPGPNLSEADGDAADAAAALRRLGLSASDARRVIEDVRPFANSLEELVTMALKHYDKRI